MKTLIAILLMTAAAYATGNGGGTMQPQPGRSASYRYMDKSLANGIILYRGETDKNVYFNLGTAQLKQWKIEQYIAEKNKLNMDSKIREALIKSKLSENWEKLEKVPSSP